MRGTMLVATWTWSVTAVLWAMTMVAPTTAQAIDSPVSPRLAPLDPAGASFRLYEGLTMLIHNPEGKAFRLTVDVRDLNLIEPNPREVLFKVYDPAGRAVVREVIPDDGVVTPIGQLPTGGWDHEGWYYLHQYNRGVAPMLRWTGMAAPDRMATVPVRTYERNIPGGAKGVYRMVLVGCRDHVVTIKNDADLKWAVGGNPFFLNPVGNLLKKRFVYIPRGATGLNIAIVEHDRPRTRKYTLHDEEGNLIAEGMAQAGIGFAAVSLTPSPPPRKAAKASKTGEPAPAPSPPAPDRPAHLLPGAWDDKVFTFELNDGPGDCMVQFSILYPRLKEMSKPLPPPALPAFYAPDPQTARALHNGAFEDDGRLFTQAAHQTLDKWVRALKPGDLPERRPDGRYVNEITFPNNNLAVPTLDLAPNRNGEYVTPNGVHERPPISDAIMFSYGLHRNRQALNAAIRDVAAALADIGPGDHVMNTTWNGMANLAYEFGTYRYHWWRPAWRIIAEKDTPPEVRDAMREIIMNAGDRLAFCSNWERVNGNAFTTVLCALRYVHEATRDSMSKQLLDTFHDRFVSGGFGARVGLGPSGAVQEEFAYDNHYGSYPTATLNAVVRDLNDPRFVKLHQGLLNFYSYTTNPDANACPFSARTFHNPDYAFPKENWKGNPGPDFAESINNANEFFAARRVGYYILSYHGRITPKWEGECFRGQMGWSGGVLCQFVVPGKGTVLASTLNGPGYGTGMHPSQWRTFHIHSIVGQTTDGRPLIGSDCEHPDARLDGNTASGSGEVRDSSVHATRSYTYNPDHVLVEAKLRMTDDDPQQAYWFQSPFRGCVHEAWEMIPFLPRARADRGAAGGNTIVKVLDASGKEVADLTTKPVAKDAAKPEDEEQTEASNTSVGQAVVIDRGGFGVRIELEKPMTIKRGENHTIMIKLVEGMPMGPRNEKTKPNVEDVNIRYRLIPFGM